MSLDRRVTRLERRAPKWRPDLSVFSDSELDELELLVGKIEGDQPLTEAEQRRYIALARMAGATV